MVDLIVAGEEALGLPGRLEALHLPFPTLRRLMRVLRAVVRPLVLQVRDATHDSQLRRGVAAAFIGNQETRCTALPLQQLAPEPLGGVFLAPALHEHVKNEAGLVDRAQAPELHADDLHRDLVEMPFVAELRQPSSDPIGERLDELQRPLPYPLVADDDATRRAQVLDHAQAERRTEVQPRRVANHRCRQPIAGDV